jgi:hypothetical protein
VLAEGLPMSIEQLENKLARAQAKLNYCERLAAWPWLSAKSALKARRLGPQREGRCDLLPAGTG